MLTPLHSDTCPGTVRGWWCSAPAHPVLNQGSRERSSCALAAAATRVSRLAGRTRDARDRRNMASHVSVMPIVVVGHVDHGKSTVVGRLLADTGSLPDGKLDAVKELCRRTSKPFEYAFLLDALRDERDQGITIDAARVFFKSAERHYVVIDAPGHVEFVRNMVTGAARADAALLVVDAHEGVRENSRRHATMLAMLGVSQVAVVVNKMDLVGWSEAAFSAVAREMHTFLGRLQIEPAAVLPVSGLAGANLVAPSSKMPWYVGPTVLETLDRFTPALPAAAAPFRMPVQDVYRFTRFGDDRRIVAGTIESGTLAVGNTVVFYPSGKRSTVASIEAFHAPARTSATAGEATGFTLDEQIYTTRGELAVRADEPPPAVSTRLRGSVFWLGRDPLVTGRLYHLRLGTARVPMRVESIDHVLDAATLATAPATAVARHDVGECVLRLDRAVAFDRHDERAECGRFVIVDDYEIRGGGIVREALADGGEAAREAVARRNLKWEPSRIAPDVRAARFAQRPAMLIVTGPREQDRKGLAKELEARLFAAGRGVYFLGMANILYGVDADIDRTLANRHEHFRRLGEIAHLMLDAGLVLIVSAAELRLDDLEVVRAGVPGNRLVTVWWGPPEAAEVACDLTIDDGVVLDAACTTIIAWLESRSVVAAS